MLTRIAPDRLPPDSEVIQLADEKREGPELSLGTPGAVLCGRVVDSLGRVAADVLVRIKVAMQELAESHPGDVRVSSAFGRARVQRTRTNSDGHYEFRGLP